MNALNGIPITMLNGFGCAECGGRCLGAVTESELKAFFIGKDKYTKSAKPVSVYKNPGDAPFKTVAAHDTIGKVVGFNSKNNWAKLEDGNWIMMAPGIIESYYTVYLTVPPPTSISDAVGREIEKIPFIPSMETLKLILWAGIIVGGVILIGKIKPAVKAATA